MRPTLEQQAAITQPGNVLLMAGAGTGKTRTLVDRCLAWLFDPRQPGSLDRVLMVTFTDAAAAEMRQRIRAALQARLDANPGDEPAAKELALLEGARIGTLHSFCLQLVRQHFHELGLDPQVSVLDDNQARLLRAEVIEELLGRHYESGDTLSAAVQQLIHERARGWDKPIRELIRQIHAHTQALRSPEAWFREQQDCLSQDEPVFWRECLRQGMVKWAGFWRPYLAALPEENESARRFAKVLAFADPAASLEDLGLVLSRIRELDLDWPPRKKTVLRKPVEGFLEEAKTLRGYFVDPNGKDPVAEDWGWVREQMLSLLALAREFAAEYAQAKRAQAALDYNDLEQFALRLLYTSDGALTPTALHWRSKFDRVFVDEYQDINAAQDAILTALAKPVPEGNRFLVGDVKQSIYRFRQANPRIFQDYAAAWSEPDAPGATLMLSENFRSHEGILKFVDALFSTVMRREVGGVEYAPLRFGAPETRAHFACANEPPEARRVELHLLLDQPEAEENEADRDEENGKAGIAAERTKVEREARFVGRRLRELHAQGLPVWDRDAGQFRPVRWNDMVVLLRACKNCAASYAKEFARLGVPLMAERGGFFEEIEVLDLLNLLRLLDNPLQDLPLLAVLRSPLVGLSPDELAAIRLAARHGRFWTALLAWDRGAGGTAAAEGKVRQFLERYRRWRDLARQHSLSGCLEEVLRETHYAEWCQAQERGEQRHANVLRLVDLARRYDPLQRQGLHRFLRFVEAHEEEELETEPAPAATRDAVRLMTIHQSKGLEFPVVALAGLGRKFNSQDQRREVVLDEEYGLCPKIKPPDLLGRYPSVVHWLAGKRARRELLGEELRLLYVAVTRACDRLILCGTATEKDTNRWAEWTAINPPAHRVLKAGNFLGWIGPWLCAETPDWTATAAGQNALLRWQVHDLRAVDQAVDAAGEPAAGTLPAEAPSDAALARLRQRLAWTYPHAAATREAAKSTVTALRRRLLLTDEEIAAPASYLPQRGFERRPAAARLTAAEIGSAHHQFLQWLSLTSAGSEASLRAEAARLAEAGELTPAQVEALDFRALAAFWQSEVGLKIRSQAGAVHRELPFTARLNAADLRRLRLLPPDHSLGDEFIVVQGIADLVVILERELWIADFKTDAARGPELEARIQQYTPQLQLYGLALGRIYGRPVAHLWLHFLTLGRTIEIDGAPRPA